MKAYWGSEGIAPRILDLRTRWRRVVSFTPRPLYRQGKSPWYPLDRRLVGFQSRSGRGGEKRNSQPLPGLEPLTIQPLAQRYTAELSWLPCDNLKCHAQWPLIRALYFIFHTMQWSDEILELSICSYWIHTHTHIRGCIQMFPDWVDNEIYAYLWYCSFRSSTKGYGGRTH
jgi:hypothetical protein